MLSALISRVRQDGSVTIRNADGTVEEIAATHAHDETGVEVK